MPKIVLENVVKRWGDFYGVEDLNLVLDDCSFITLLGPSGCGKTTTLRMIAGLETPTSGRITIGDTVVFDSELGINVPPNKRHVGFLFQNYALWPHMTVYKNILFGLQNVNQVMPLHASQYERCMKMSSKVKEVETIKKSIAFAIDKNGKVDEKKALLNLIDNLTISMYSAKEIRKLGFDCLSDEEAMAKAEEESVKYLDMANEELAKLQEKGYSVNEAYNLTQNGEEVSKQRHLDKEEIDLAVRYVSRVVKIGEFMDRYPSELSGGQQQRVAIARTLAPGPKVLFMDEPLSNLDAKLRLEMRAELKRLHVETGSTFVYVTHDQLEAMTLATKICLIENGVLQQYDPPLTVYKKPSNLFVADFVGNPAINFVEIKASQKGKTISVAGLDGKLKAKFEPEEPLSLEKAILDRNEDEAMAAQRLEEKRAEKGYVEKGNADKPFNIKINKVTGTVISPSDRPFDDDDYVLGIRPEFIRVGEGNLEAEIYGTLPAGSETTVRLRVGNYILTSIVYGGVDYEVGSKVKIDVVGQEIVLFDRKSGKLVASGSLKI